MKDTVSKIKNTTLSDVVIDYKYYRNLLNTLFQKQLNGTITFDEITLQYVVYKKVRRLEKTLYNQIKTVKNVA